MKLKCLFYLSLIVISCQNSNNKDNNQLITFDLKELPEITNLKLSDLGFVDIEYIPMETNEQSMISGTNDLIDGNKILAGEGVYLSKYGNTILKFQSNGSFVARIGTVGRGPNEFLVAHDVDINSHDRSIYIVSAWQKKFNVYSENGEFLRTFKMPLYAHIDFRFIDGNILCYCENHMGNIENSYTLLDTNGQVLKSFPNRYPFKNHDAFGFTQENLFYRFNNRLFKKEVYSDTIYVYENNDFKPHLVIEVGKKLITPDARSEFDGMYIAKNYIGPLNLFEFGDYVYYEFIYRFVIPDDVLIYSFIGSKKNNFRAIINTGQGIINDLDGGPNILPKTIKDDNTIIAWVDALKLKTHITSEAFKNSIPKYPEKKEELEKLANSLKETDNPVLILVRLKE
jgi:6-bladed beta-propeller